MSLHARRRPAAVEIPGLAHFSALPEVVKPAACVAKPPQPLDFLNEMYAYYTES